MRCGTGCVAVGSGVSSELWCGRESAELGVKPRSGYTGATTQSRGLLTLTPLTVMTHPRCEATRG